MDREKFVIQRDSSHYYSGVTRFSVLFVLLHCLLGCATSGLFVPYPNQMSARLQALDRGEPVKAIKSGGKWNPDKLLHHLEQGRLAQISQDDTLSKEEYRLAIEIFNEQDLKALVELSDLGEKGASLLVNDNTIGYDGEIYERVFVHIYQALNYLLVSDLEGAGVEIRRLNRVQSSALEKNEKALLKQKEQADAKLKDVPIDMNQNQGQFDERFSAMDAEAAKLKYSFQNGLGFYVSALVYECRAEYNDAYIDYKKALELNPNNEFIQQSVIRLAKQLGFTADYNRLKKSIKWQPLGKDQGEIIVLYEKGFAPQKQEVKFSVLDLRGTLISISFPAYNQFVNKSSPLTVKLGQSTFYKTDLVARVAPMAAKALKDKRPMMIARQVARGIAKAELHHRSEKEGGALGSLLANIYNIISERADLRSWLTLPNNAQIGRYAVKAGEYPLMMRDIQTGAQHDVSVRVEAGRKTIIYVVNTGGRLRVRSVLI